MLSMKNLNCIGQSNTPDFLLRRDIPTVNLWNCENWILIEIVKVVSAKSSWVVLVDFEFQNLNSIEGPFHLPVKFLRISPHDSVSNLIGPARPTPRRLVVFD